MKAKPTHTRKEAAPKAGVGQGSPEMRKGSQITVPPEIPHQWARCYRKLIRMRERLNEDRADLVRDANAPLAPYSMDMADAASDEYEREMEWTEVSSSQELLFEIDEALQRMRSGVYGICERSGKPIPHRRLEAVPWARFTEEVEEQLEREGSIPRSHLEAAHST